MNDADCGCVSCTAAVQWQTVTTLSQPKRSFFLWTLFVIAVVVLVVTVAMATRSVAESHKLLSDPIFLISQCSSSRP